MIWRDNPSQIRPNNVPDASRKRPGNVLLNFSGQVRVFVCEKCFFAGSVPAALLFSICVRVCVRTHTHMPARALCYYFFGFRDVFSLGV